MENRTYSSHGWGEDERRADAGADGLAQSKLVVLFGQTCHHESKDV